MTGRDTTRPGIGRRRAGMLVLSGLAFAGCGGASGAGLPPRDALGGPMRFGVASIDVITAYTPPSGAPHIEHRMAEAPAARMAEWARAKLIPAGGRGNLLVTITRAALTEGRLSPSGGAGSVFRDEQNRLVRVEFEGVFQFAHPEGRRSASLTVSARYERSIAESASVSMADQIREYVVAQGLARFDMQFRQEARGASGSGWPLIGG